MDQFSRTRFIIGEESLRKLKNSHIAIFGLGGVGGCAAEAFARAGIGKLDIIDNDKIEITNLNRQITALHSTLGEYKTDAARKRLIDINPDMVINSYKCFFLPETADIFDFSKYDYVVDATDTVTAKLEIAEKSQRAATPVISCMGTGNKIEPSKLKIDDIFKTSVCPLAKVMRKECRNRGINKLKVLYSTEQPLKQLYKSPDEKDLVSDRIPGSISFVPSCAGFMIAGEVIRDIIYGGLKI